MTPIKSMTLGSLFDGIGGFPLSAVMCGIEPRWASEIEPFPILVTHKRFPNMKHLGSVTDINGAEVEPVDIITFGSPCQDLSVAGKQAGIHEGARSNLFFEAVRIIKEMRQKDESTGRSDVDIRPRYAVWENVPGAFSSNGGKDFQAVLQALAEVADPDVSIPLPDGGKWLKAGCIVGEGYSIAWRVYDAQYWGVPQRRKRIYLIADFGSERAGEVLFEPESLRGDSSQGGTPWQRASSDAQGSTGRSGSPWSIKGFDAYQHHNWRESETIGTLTTAGATVRGDTPLVVSYGVDCRNAVLDCEKTHTLQAKTGGGFSLNYTPSVLYEPKSALEENWDEATVKNALRANASTSSCAVVCCQNTGQGWWNQSEIAQTLRTPCGGDSTKANLVTYCLQGNDIDRADTAGCNGRGWRTDASYTLNTLDRPAVVYGIDSLSSNSMKSTNHNSGFHEMDVAKRIDTSDGNPSKNQGGMCVVEAASSGKEIVCLNPWDIQSSRIYGCEGAFAALDAHAGGGGGDNRGVVYPLVTGALCANSHPGSYTGQDAFNDMLPVIKTDKPSRRYIVRRLTPLECCRLQGYPDGWTENLAVPDPTIEEVEFFTKVWADWAEINGTKPKSLNQVIKWLAEPQSDSAEYKAYGNSLAIPCSYDVLRRIANNGKNDSDRDTGR